MKMGIVLFSLFLSSLSLASFTKGNGGNALICEGQSSAIILDYFETTEVLGFTVDEALQTHFDQSIFERVFTLADQLNSASARAFASNIKFHSEQFFKQTSWISGAALGPVNDSFHLATPAGCTLEQAAVQSTSRYFIQADIWSRLPEVQKDTLRLHELIYRTLLTSQRLEDSRPVRALVGLLLSLELSKMNSVELKQFLKTHEIKF